MFRYSMLICEDRWLRETRIVIRSFSKDIHGGVICAMSYEETAKGGDGLY